MSAAFDLVDQVQKLVLFGFDSDSVARVRSNVELRRQSVMIRGCLSKLFKVNSGVLQGSILGPLFFTLFSNELPEVIHDTAINQLDPEPDVKQGWPAYAYQVEGGVQEDVCYYADDTTLSMSDTDPVRLSAKLSTEYKEIAKYMV